MDTHTEFVTHTETVLLSLTIIFIIFITLDGVAGFPTHSSRSFNVQLEPVRHQLILRKCNYVNYMSRTCLRIIMCLSFFSTTVIQ